MRERPTHRRPGFIAVVPGRGVPRYDAFAVFEVGCEDAVKSRQIQPGSGHQGGESGDEVERFQHDMGGAIPKRLLVAVHDPATTIDREAVRGNGRPSNVAAQSFQSAALVGFANGGGV